VNIRTDRLRNRGYRAIALLALLVVASGCRPQPAEDAETVVLVHGLGRTSASLIVLEARLESAGYRVVSFDYPSRTETMEVLVDSLASVVTGCCEERAREVHFVTHSLGGVLVRSYLRGGRLPHDGRVVMLSPPNQGSEIVDAFSPSPLLVSVVGPTGARLGTDSTSALRELGPVGFSLGIIAGDRSITPLGSWLIPGPDDGFVGVDQSRVEGAADFMVVPSTHTMIMNRSDVAAAVVAFLQAGRFDGSGG